jgi:hypothetical protein
MRTLICCVLLVLGLSAPAWSLPPEQAAKIDYLIGSVEQLQSAQFIRNGAAYDGRAAADHLRLKLKNAGSRVATVEDFIRLCGSASSMSGQAYQIRFADGHSVTSEQYFRQRLAQYKP